MVFRGTEGGSVALTEYKGGNYRKLNDSYYTNKGDH